MYMPWNPNCNVQWRSVSRLFAIAVATTNVAAIAADINVPGDEPTIQRGIDAAQDGDRVLVAEGSYSESIDFHGKNLQVMATGRPDKTVISAAGHAHAVVFQSGEAEAALAGFSIENANASGSGKDSAGGGILVTGTAAPDIHDNFIHDNRACDGAGIAVFDAARPRMHDNRIQHNAATNCDFGHGGGVGISGLGDGRVGIINNILVQHGNHGVACGADDGGMVFDDNLIYTPEGVTSEGNCTWQGTLLTTDPQFVGGSDKSHGYWLLPTSPAIDAGENGATDGYNTRDLTGAARISGQAVDMGAIEFRQGG